MKHIRILHVVGDSQYGGGSVIIERLCEVAKLMGWEPQVLTTDKTFQKRLRALNIGILDLPCIWRSTRPFRDIVGLCRLVRFLKKERIEVVHTHTSKAGIMGRFAASIAGTPLIIHTVHGFAFHEESNRLALAIFSVCERIAARWCDRIITVSKFHRDWALRLGIGDPHKVVAIPNGIPHDRVASRESREKIRESLNLAEGELAIVTPGRLAPQKGLEYLLMAVPAIEELMDRPYRILLVGDGPLKRYLEDMASELSVSHRVDFLGFRSDVGNILKAADVIVLPSLREGLSISLLESMAAERPVITTSIGSNIEVSCNGKGAVLVAPKDAHSLARAIAELCCQPRVRNSYARRGNQIYCQAYTEAGMMREYRRVYLEVFKEKILPC